jgi:hypothetical protein
MIEVECSRIIGSGFEGNSVVLNQRDLDVDHRLSLAVHYKTPDMREV